MNCSVYSFRSDRRPKNERPHFLDADGESSNDGSTYLHQLSPLQGEMQMRHDHYTQADRDGESFWNTVFWIGFLTWLCSLGK